MSATRSRRTARRAALAAVPVGAVAGLLLALAPSQATVLPGTSGRDVHLGPDDDVATNPLVQPAGATVRQDMAGADVLFGRGEDDLLVGNRGSDVLLGGPGSDVSVGGPDGGPGAPVPAGPGLGAGYDVSVGDIGDDVHVWSPGDANDAFSGNQDDDTLLVGRLVTNADGSVWLSTALGRQLPRVAATAQSGITCSVVTVPASSGLGAQQLVRVTVSGKLLGTIRDRDVEQVVCPSTQAGRVLVAHPFATTQAFVSTEVSSLDPLLQAMVS